MKGSNTPTKVDGFFKNFGTDLEWFGDDFGTVWEYFRDGFCPISKNLGRIWDGLGVLWG